MIKTKARKRTIVRLSRKQRLEELRQFISLCFTLWEGTHDELAKKSGLCNATVSRLYRGDYTLAIRVNTLMVMAYSTGLKLELVEGKTLVTLID